MSQSLSSFLIKSLLRYWNQGIMNCFVGFVFAGQERSNRSRTQKSDDRNLSNLALTYGAIELGSRRTTSAIRRVFSMKSMADFKNILFCADPVIFNANEGQ